MQKEIISLHEILKNNNIKPSLIRIKILEYIIKSKAHPTADEIYKKLKAEIPTLSKTSVYLNLNLFLKKKLIQSIQIKEEQHFDYMGEEHINFYCTKCEKIIDIPLEKAKININIENFIIEKINIEGVCKNCGKY